MEKITTRDYERYRSAIKDANDSKDRKVLA